MLYCDYYSDKCVFCFGNAGGGLVLTYDMLRPFDGQVFYTVAEGQPATQCVNDTGIIVIYPSGKKLQIPRQTVEAIMASLMQGKSLTRD